ncbi:MAG: hypothetical protein GY941_11090 [Planctomycetes bacterium]|nr:hypothetical protein [Planctomycetota bacterium]
MVCPSAHASGVVKTLDKLERKPGIGIIIGWGYKLCPAEDICLKVDFIIEKSFDLTMLTERINNVISTQ